MLAAYDGSLVLKGSLCVAYSLCLLGARCGGCSKVAADLGPGTRLGIHIEACDSAGAAYEALLSASVNEILGLAVHTSWLFEAPQLAARCVPDPKYNSAVHPCWPLVTLGRKTASPRPPVAALRPFAPMD